MTKHLRNILFTSLLLAFLILLIPAFGLRNSSASTKPKLSPKKATLTVGETVQLKMKGANVISYKIKKTKYASVDAGGLVTALKATSKVVKVRVKCDNGKTYKCKLYIVAQGGAGTSGGSKTGSATPVAIGSGSNATYVNSVAELESAGYTGWFNPQKKTKYKATYEYDGVITNKEQLYELVSEGLRNGAEEIKFAYKGNFYTKGDNSCWWEWLNSLTREYSVLSGYGNLLRVTMNTVTSSSGKKKSATIIMTYKEAWKAVTYLKHTGYEPTSDAKKIADRCVEIVDEALAAGGDDKMAVLRYINDKICATAEYAYSAAGSVVKNGSEYKVDSQHDATGILFEGKGVCEAYTATFRVCMEILGLENYVINNKATASEGDYKHTWNYVKVDGSWYHCDVTWNDTWDNQYFMLNESGLAKMREKEDNKGSHVFYTSYFPQ